MNIKLGYKPLYYQGFVVAEAQIDNGPVSRPKGSLSVEQLIGMGSLSKIRCT
jgi:hypothetical protein